MCAVPPGAARWAQGPALRLPRPASLALMRGRRRRRHPSRCQGRFRLHRASSKRQRMGAAPQAQPNPAARACRRPPRPGRAVLACLGICACGARRTRRRGAAAAARRAAARPRNSEGVFTVGGARRAAGRHPVRRAAPGARPACVCQGAALEAKGKGRRTERRPRALLGRGGAAAGPAGRGACGQAAKVYDRSRPGQRHARTGPGLWQAAQTRARARAPRAGWQEPAAPASAAGRLRPRSSKLREPSGRLALRPRRRLPAHQVAACGRPQSERAGGDGVSNRARGRPPHNTTRRARPAPRTPARRPAAPRSRAAHPRW